MNPTSFAILQFLEFVVVVPLAVFIAKTVFAASLSHEFNRKLEDYKNQLKIREQAAAIGEYVARANQLPDVEEKEAYIRANQLALELFLWLPTNTYRDLGKGLINSENKVELVKALVEVRRLLLGQDAGDLGADDIIVHHPNIGRRNFPNPK
jgi:hypothetical protein